MSQVHLREIHNSISNGSNAKTKELIKSFLKNHPCPELIKNYLEQYLNNDVSESTPIKNDENNILRVDKDKSYTFISENIQYKLNLLESKSLKLPNFLESPIYKPTEKYISEFGENDLTKVASFYENHNFNFNVSKKKLEELKIKANQYSKCFVVANGPSLNKTNLYWLDDQFTIGMNNIYLHPNFKPDILVVEDHLVAEDRFKRLNQLKEVIKVFPAYLLYCLEPQRNTIILDHRPRISYPVDHDLSSDLPLTYTGGTVTYTSLQLALWLGFEEIYIVGADSNYVVPKDTLESKNYSTSILGGLKKDINHFDDSYFGKGYRWHDPNPLKMIQSYRKIKQFAENKKIKIINSGYDGKLEVFKRKTYHQVFQFKYPKVGIIDWIPSGFQSATGQLKLRLFRNFDKSKLLTICTSRKDDVITYNSQPSDTFSISQSNLENIVCSIREVIKFSPEVLLIRFTHDRLELTFVSLIIIALTDINFLNYLMDDWIIQIKTESTKHFFTDVLDFMNKHSSANIYISPKMRDLMPTEYEWENKSKQKSIVIHNYFYKQLQSHENPFQSNNNFTNFAYAGDLSKEKSLEAIELLLSSLKKISGQLGSFCFHLIIPQKDKNMGEKLKQSYPFIKVLEQKKDHLEYIEYLNKMDILFLCYNFLEKDKAYLKYSLANKLSDYLESNRPFLTIGPIGNGTVDYLLKFISDDYLLTQNNDITQKLSNVLKEFYTNREDFQEKFQNSTEKLINDFSEKGNLHAFEKLLNLKGSSRDINVDFRNELYNLISKHIDLIENKEVKNFIAILNKLINKTNIDLNIVREKIKNHGISWSISKNYNFQRQDCLIKEPKLEDHLSSFIVSGAHKRFNFILDYIEKFDSNKLEK